MEKNKLKKMYALSTVRTSMEAIIDGNQRTLKSDVGFLLVFKTKNEAEKHRDGDAQILEIIIA